MVSQKSEPSTSGPQISTKQSEASSGPRSEIPPASTSPAYLVIFACSPWIALEALSPDYNPADSGIPPVRRSHPDRRTHDAAAHHRKKPALDGVSRRTHPPLRRILPKPEQEPSQHRVLFLPGPRMLSHGRSRQERKIMKLMAAGFHQYLCHLANLHQHLRESRYLIRPEN